MDALVTVRFKFFSVCDPSDLTDLGFTLEEMVRYLIKEEGLMSVVNGEGEIVAVEELK